MRTTMHTTESVAETRSALSRFSWAIADAWTITLRDLQHWRLQPGPVILGWCFPIMIVLMPGMFTTTMLFGLEATMIAVTTDAAKGVTDRFRSMPISASAVVLGRCIADMLNSVVGLAVMVVAGLMLGWRWHNGLASAILAIGLLLLLRFALLWIGIYMGLRAKGPEAVTSVQILVWPVSFLSNVFVDPATMPNWLGAIAQWNPLSATTSAIRRLFMNPGWQGDAWIVQNSLLMAILWPTLLIAVFLPLSVRAYRRLSR